MSDVQTTLSTVIAIFLLLLAGYGARKLGALKSSDAVVVNSLIINLTMPAFIFVNTHEKTLTTSMIKAPILGVAVEMAVLGVAYLFARLLRLDRPTSGALMLVSTFGNTGFLGYPMVNAAFKGNGQAILTAVMFDSFAMAIILYSVGVAVATSFAGAKFEWSSLVRFLKTPLFPATIVSLALRKVWVPPLIVESLAYLGAATVPLAMISIGLSLSTGSVKNYPLPLAVASVLKMGLMPVLMALTLPLIGVHGLVYKVCVLESVVPSAVMTGVLSARYKANGEFAAAAVFVTTLLSVVVIPIVLHWLG
jgi:malate permease and related proteins